MESSPLSPARPGVVLKIAFVYLVFGIAHAMVGIVYCTYRANAGNPSDLPCVSLLWTSIDLLGWPQMAFGAAVSGHAILVPGILVRAYGIAFLGGFVLTLAGVLRDPRRSFP